VVARAPSGVNATSTPSPEDIARRAYEIYLGRNGASGDPVDDWLQAERELMFPAKPRRRVAMASA